MLSIFSLFAVVIGHELDVSEYDYVAVIPDLHGDFRGAIWSLWLVFKYTGGR